jgi:hypothetical protein
MALYGANLTTRYIDPVFERSNLRAEFRLQPDTLYLSNLRLLGVGSDASTVTNYNALVGALASIASIQLYDGNQLLDQVLQATILNAFRNQLHDNDSNLSVNRYLSYTGLGFLASGVDGNGGGVKVREQNGFAPNEGQQAWVSLKAMLPFLASSLVMPTNVFKKPRLVINYSSQTDLQNSLFQQNSTAPATFDNLTGMVLVADEMNAGDMKDAMMSNYDGVRYSPIEHDSVILPAITGLADTTAEDEKKETRSFNVNGFNNKYLKRLVLVNTATDKTTWQNGAANTLYSNQGSLSFFKPRVQLRVNGSDLLPREGFIGHNRRLAQLTDAWGTQNLVNGGQFTSIEGAADVIDVPVDRCGSVDYTGVKVERQVSELIVDVERSGVFGNADLNQAIRLNMFGEVAKAVVMKPDGGYQVVYE